MDRNALAVWPGLLARPSLSVRRAWIEMFSVHEVFANFEGSLSVRRAWIEIQFVHQSRLYYSSLSVRRAWIEIFVPFDVIRPAIGRSP